jgi:pyrimidine operon attenuation protein/uracil phosphoribosyltransferase
VRASEAAGARIRFAKTLQFMQQQLPGVSLVLEGLFATQKVEDYKKKNYNQRALLISGTYASKYTDWQNKNVLLVDDVLTSGSTMDECTRVLMANKAGRVHAVSLAADQHASARSCPVAGCDGRLSLTPNKWKGAALLGCSRWKKDKTGSNYTEDYVP